MRGSRQQYENDQIPAGAGMTKKKNEQIPAGAGMTKKNGNDNKKFGCHENNQILCEILTKNYLDKFFIKSFTLMFFSAAALFKFSVKSFTPLSLPKSS